MTMGYLKPCLDFARVKANSLPGFQNLPISGQAPPSILSVIVTILIREPLSNIDRIYWRDFPDFPDFFLVSRFFPDFFRFFSIFLYDL